MKRIHEAVTVLQSIINTLYPQKKTNSPYSNCMEVTDEQVSLILDNIKENIKSNCDMLLGQCTDADKENLNLEQLSSLYSFDKKTIINSFLNK